MLQLNSQEIQEILPQRYPFLMLDRVIEIEPGKRVVAIKNVTHNENFFRGHFPGQPIMPGVLIIEAMAQAGIVLFHYSKNIDPKKKMTYYLGAVKARFLNPVTPGDQLVITVEPMKVIAQVAIVKAGVKVQDKEVASAEITLVAKA